MTLEQLWQTYIEQNPHWETEGVKLTAKGLEKLFEQTWKQGYSYGNKEAITQGIRDQFGDFSELFKN